MDLEQFKEKWQQTSQREVSRQKLSPQELTAMLIALKAKLEKEQWWNKFWLITILAGIGICLGGYFNFRFQYSPQRFPNVNISLYDAIFVAGIIFILFKLALSTWWTVLFSALAKPRMDTTLKASLQTLTKYFQYIYRSSLYGSCLFLPPLLFFEIRLLSPLMGWQVHQQEWLNALYALLLSLLCIGIGHYYYRKTFQSHTRQLKQYLSYLDEANI